MNIARVWGLWVVLALGLGLAWLGVRLPAPAPITAPADAFSAVRAMETVRLIATRPHPIGSAENDRVRGLLLSRMADLGLSPTVREGVGIAAPKWAKSVVAAGTTRDLLGVLPGRDRGLPAVLLMAHYDSVPNSPGAADDAAGVATALETVRALKAAGRHARDVMVLITDGEESGLLGAESFLHTDAEARRIGVVLNMETRGDAGRASMFETGDRQGPLTAFYARAAAHPSANAMTSFIYHLLPNDTDFTHARQAGLPGLNFAFVGDQLAYHTPLATLEHLSQASLQHMGGQVAPVARALADAPALPPRAPDQVYSDVFQLGVVSYPAAAGWLVVLAAAALTGTAAWRARRAGHFRWLQLVRGVALALTAVLMATLALHAAGLAMGAASYTRQYHLLARPELLFAGAAALAAGVTLLVVVGATRGGGIFQAWAGASLAFAVACVAQGRLDVFALGLAAGASLCAVLAFWRKVAMWSGWLGALMVLLVVAVGLQATAPPVAMLFGWTVLVAASAALAITVWEGRAPWLGWLKAGSGAVVGLAVLGGWAEALFTALGAATPAALAMFVLLLLPLLHPLAAAWAEGRRKRMVAFGVAAAGALALGAVAVLPSPADRPDLAQAFHYAEPAAGVSLRVSALPVLDAWSRATLEAEGGRVRREPLPPLLPDRVWTAPAQARALPAPVIAASRQGGVVRVTATPTNAGRQLTLMLRAPGGVTDLHVGGRATPATALPGAWTRVVYDAPPAAGVVVEARASGPVEVVAAERADGWPAGVAVPAKPAGRMAWQSSDTTLTMARASLR